MSKKASPALVGAFILGAAALAVAGVLVFGGAKLFERKAYCVAYFEESIGGLDIGAPVEFKGIRIGTVTDVRLVLNTGDTTLRRPVTFAIEEGRLTYAGDESREQYKHLKRCIADGLRARLGSQSMVTGKLKVELDFRPDSPMNLVGAQDTPYLEMPTVPSPLARLSQEVDELPLSEIILDTHRAIQGVADLITSEETQGTMKSINTTLADLQGVLREIEKRIAPMSEKTHQTLASASNTLADVSRLVVDLDREVVPFLRSLTVTSEKMSAMMDEQSPIRAESLRALEETTRAAQALRNLADFLDRHPEALLRGKRE